MSVVNLDRSFIEKLMFGTGRVRRFTQDSPVLPDVWLAYAGAVEDESVVPSRHGAVHLLLTPFHETAPGTVRNELSKLLDSSAMKARKHFGHDERSMPVIYNQTTVSAELYFEDLVRAVLPLTAWWQKLAEQIPLLVEEEVRRLVALAIQNPENPGLRFGEKDHESSYAKPVLELPADVFWLVRIVGTMTLAMNVDAPSLPRVFDVSLTDAQRDEEWRRVVDAVMALVADLEPAIAKPLIYTASLNRAATLSIARSTLAIKADAARQLFNISCKEIRWAIIDCGIDARHPAFRKDADAPPFLKDEKSGAWKNNTRIVGTYDFSVVHKLLDRANPEIPERFLKLAEEKTEAGREAKGRIRRLKAMLKEGDAIDWGIVGPLLEVPQEAEPSYLPPPANLDHGTHVAGILGGNWKKNDSNKLETDLVGVCPDINFYDVRVISPKGVGGEFAIMSAMQFVRWLNTTHATQGVHGTNLSLSIRHDISNYACGRTPVCEEAERLVASGVVVVSAAGNYGHRRYSTPEGTAEAYNSISIVDPGNADSVITVGATHRFKPHTYGVSYFSSRGPTGDGRVKPDLVAPGEKIMSPIRSDGVGVKDGTSMAAPHVSGAAALLMARHQELIGNPARIKKILCDTATDLGRERYFQGHGMLDVLRALQAV
ncbi:MAG TPA: S8 family serine peptidase [Thermoanaerobaculia bacterium]|nr:S8 family serine peptidase [Thermoanaerobaculia bacterium]